MNKYIMFTTVSLFCSQLVLAQTQTTSLVGYALTQPAPRAPTTRTVSGDVAASHQKVPGHYDGPTIAGRRVKGVLLVPNLTIDPKGNSQTPIPSTPRVGYSTGGPSGSIVSGAGVATLSPLSQSQQGGHSVYAKLPPMLEENINVPTRAPASDTEGEGSRRGR